MLFVILIVCFVAIICVALTFFYSKNESVYGSRLDDIEKYPIKDKVKKDFKESLTKEDRVKKVTMTIKGRIIYVHISFDDEITLDDAKVIAEKSLELFSDKIKSYYDIEFMLKSKNFNIIGAKNSVSENLAWNNNRVVEGNETDEES